MATKTSSKVKAKDAAAIPTVEPIETVIVEQSPDDEKIYSILQSRISESQDTLKNLFIQRDNIASEIEAAQQGIDNCNYLLTKTGLNLSDFTPECQ
jgi:hypothetical protein